jgi:gliding motility-associated-like protein
MKRFIYILFILVAFNQLNIKATHNRAGEITYKQISQLTYEITITTFTYTRSAADRSQLDVMWGDNTVSVANRISETILPDFYKKNVYKARHTFPGPGSYEIIVQDPNRNLGVQNIPNSVNVIFSIKTTLVINPNVGFNNTPVLLNYPIDIAALNQPFIHNPAAFDFDGDSLSYSLTVCTGEDGVPIPNYTFPEASKSLRVDSITGDLIWDSPVQTGIYNIAMNITEWRDGVRIGNIVRDMQIEVVQTDNNAPVNDPIPDFCVVAGDSLGYFITSTDVDGDNMKQSAVGGPFEMEISPAKFQLDSSAAGYSSSLFSWNTTCQHVRDALYYVVVKSEDLNLVTRTDTLKTVDIDNFAIQVLGPPPQNLNAFPQTESITVTWDPYECSNISGFEIYRRTGFVEFEPDSCSNEIPPLLNFEKIGEVNDPNTNQYIDTRLSGQLEQGKLYCYLVVAVFENGARSIPSELICSSLLQGFPSIIQVSVEQIDDLEGEIQVSWIKPSSEMLDSLNGGAPYEYRIFRALPDDVTDYQQIEVYNDLNDTVFIDENINTFEYPYYYRVDLYYTDGNTGELELASNGGIASSTWLDLQGVDNAVVVSYQKDTPWQNIEDSVFTRMENQTEFELLDVISGTNTYVHSNLINGDTYHYRLTGLSQYVADSIEYLTINKTHPGSATPVDTVAPCQPVLSVESLCDSAINKLTWQLPMECNIEDIEYYNIYYSPNDLDTMQLIYSTTDNRVFEYMHQSEISLAGCYRITAVDSFNNESPGLVKLCVDNCNIYKLPNVFTPNGDNINDVYQSVNINSYVKEVDMKIYNRWGKLVYETTNPDIKWDGRHKDNNNIVPSGVYYYICDVYEPRLSGVMLRNITGFIHVYSSDDAQQINSVEN